MNGSENGRRSSSEERSEKKTNFGEL